MQNSVYRSQKHRNQRRAAKQHEVQNGIDWNSKEKRTSLQNGERKGIGLRALVKGIFSDLHSVLFPWRKNRWCACSKSITVINLGCETSGGGYAVCVLYVIICA